MHAGRENVNSVGAVIPGRPVLGSRAQLRAELRSRYKKLVESASVNVKV